MSPLTNSSASSVVIARLRADAMQAVMRRLWSVMEKYFLRMMLLARKKLAGAANRGQDEEDIAVSAFKSFCMGCRPASTNIVKSMTCGRYW